MSRGLGKVERYILNEITTKKYCLIKDVPGLQPSVSRAACRLANQKLIGYYSILLNLTDKRWDKPWRKESRKVGHIVCIAVSPNTSDKEFYDIRTDAGLFNNPPSYINDGKRMSYEEWHTAYERSFGRG